MEIKKCNKYIHKESKQVFRVESIIKDSFNGDRVGFTVAKGSFKTKYMFLSDFINECVESKNDCEDNEILKSIAVGVNAVLDKHFKGNGVKND